MKKMNKWFYAFLAAAVVVLGVTIALIIVSVNANKTPPADEILSDGAETGIYYYDAVDGEILLTFNSGNKFTIAGPALNKSGEYTVNGESITLDFVRDEDGTAPATVKDGVVTLTYNGATMSFLKKVNYTVSYNTNGGTSVESMNVVNGKTPVKPEDPTKDGFVFIGWYSDSACTTPYHFGVNTVTSDVTVYARWAEKVVGQPEYNVDFNLGYENAETLSDVVTVGGKLYNLPTPNRDGYTFGGWFVSMYEDGEKLTYAYTEDIVLNADTTLFAVWNDKGSDKLSTPAVSVGESTVKWTPVSGANSYRIVIKDASGVVLLEETIGTTTKNYDFTSLSAGDYTVEVTAVASNTANNSDAAVRYYKNKALGRVSRFQVVDGILVFGAVEGADKYLITIDCGNDEHVHTLFDNGSSTSFNFSNCSMQAGGIKFNVTAVAEGYASSVSETFVYDRTLAGVGQVIYDAAKDAFVWNEVTGATKYMVKITAGDKSYTIDNSTLTSVSVAGYTGEITVSVVPVSAGYNSPEASVASTTKTAPATPTGLTFNGMILSWNAVDGATSYEVKIGTRIFTVTEATFDLNSSKIQFEIGREYDVQVKAVKDAESSAYSNAISVYYYGMNPNLSYKNNRVYWIPVIGAEVFEIRVNGGEPISVSGTDNAKVTLTKAGTNIIEVRYADHGGSEWASIEVTAYEITYKSRTLGGEITEYVAVGDTMTLPESFENNGYYFSGWYNTPNAASGNGKEYTDKVFYGNGALTLYANWSPKTYKVTFQTDGFDIGNIDQGSTSDATFTKDYILPVPVSTNPVYGTFVGWYTGPAGSGDKLTDANGISVTKFPFARDTVAYPFFDTGILTFELRADGTYGVKRGPNFDSVENITIPYSYNGIAVTTILENAFSSRKNMVTIDIPDSIKLVGTGAFSGCSKLQSINVYEVEGNHEIFYSSSDGSLLRDDYGTIYLEVFPRAKTGTFVVPPEVDIIRNKVFQYSKIEKVIISNGVNSISEQAFYQCSSLTSVEFEGERETAVSIASNAFYKCTSVTHIKLPAFIEELDFAMFDSLTALEVIEAEAGGDRYGAMNGWLTNGVGDILLYVPATVEGAIEIPLGIQHIDDKAFYNRPGITEVIIPNFVKSIGESAFELCTGIKNITFNGSRNNDLVIKDRAFSQLSALTEVKFLGNGTTTADAGKITIGAFAFSPFEEYEVLNYGEEPTLVGYTTKLKSVTFDNGVNIALIGESAFANCSSLSTLSFSDAATVTEIGPQAFENNTSIPHIVIPKSTASIGNRAFAGCTAVGTLTISEGGSDISFGEYVFGSCSRLVTVYLPATVTTFSGTVFDGCMAIREIIVDEDNKYLESIGGILYDEKITEIKFYPKALPTDAETLAALPWNTLTKIGASVFNGNESLTSIVIGKNITEIGEKAFYNCKSLTSVIFEEGGSDLIIGNSAFSGSKLSGIELPAYTSAINASAFEGCSSITGFVIPEGVKTIGDKAFKGLTGISTINIPANVESIGDGAFAGCSNLTSVTFSEGTKPLELGTVANSTKANGIFYGTKIASFVVPARVTVIGSYAFNHSSNNSYLTSFTVADGSKLESIGNYAFDSCRKLSTVDLGGSLKSIGSYAFNDTRLLATITIPNTVEYIGAYAFAATSSSYAKLENVIFEMGGTAPLDIGAYAFRYAKFTEITFPNRLNNTYTVTNVGGSGTINAKDFNYIFNGANSLASINVEAGSKKYVSIDGVLYETDANGVPVILLYVPVANEGKIVNGTPTYELIVPKTVHTVEPAAIYNLTKLKTLTFEEYAKNDKNYAVPVLSIGNGSTPTDTSYAWSAIGGSNNTITTINLPSHLAFIGPKGISSTKNDLTLNFNPDATVEFSTFALQGCKATKLNLPKVIRVDDWAFKGCSKATEVTFAEGTTVESLDQHAFDGCSSVQSFQLPKSVRSMATQVFYGNKALTTFEVPEDSMLNEIGDRCFDGTGLTSFTFPSQVTILGTFIFANCKNLTEVYLPATISGPMIINHPEYTALGLCDSIEKIIVDEKNPFLKSIDGVLYDKAETILYYFPTAKEIDKYVIPDTVTRIEQYAFYGFKGSEIVIPANVDYIGTRAFYQTSITTVTIPANVKVLGAHTFSYSASLAKVLFAEGSTIEIIGDYCFYSCESLASIDLPDTINSFSTGGNFAYCTSLKELILPAALTSLPDGALTGCYSLENIVMQEGIESIGNGAIQGRNDMTLALQSITIPASVKSISNYAFRYQTAVKSVIFAQGSQLETLGYNCFSEMSSLKSISLPASLVSMDKENFYGCTSLETVEMAGNLSALPYRTFTGCENLRSVTLPEGLKQIGEDVFVGIDSTWNGMDACVKLESIVIPASVEFIGNNTFNGCTGLKSVIFEDGSKLTALGDDESVHNNIFKDTVSLETVVLPSSLEFLGAGTFYNSGVKTINLPGSLTTIGDYAFYNCTRLEKADIYSNVTYLGDYAFYNCRELTDAVPSFGLEYFGGLAFGDCVKLTTAYIPATVIKIGANPYSGCSGITYFELDPDNKNYTMADGVLYDITMYTLLYYPASIETEHVVIDSNVHEIAAGAFSGATMKSIDIPARIGVIQANTFKSCPNLEIVNIESGISEIGERAFMDCDKLNNVVIPSSVNVLGDYAFSDCDSLNNFTFTEKSDIEEPYTIGMHFFEGCDLITEVILPNKHLLSEAEAEYSWYYYDDLTIPSYMFADTGIVDAVIPEHIVDLNTCGVFMNCSKLKTVTFEAPKLDSECLGNYFFAGCTALEEITIPYGCFMPLTPSEGHVFEGCTSLKEVNIYSDASMPGMGSGIATFKDCTSLTDINLYLQVCEEIPETGEYKFTTVADNYFFCYDPNCFENCTSITELNLDYYAYVDDEAFKGCTGLKKVTFDSGRNSSYGYIESSFERIGDGAFEGCTGIEELYIFDIMNGGSIGSTAFAGWTEDQTIYFVNYTRDEIVDISGCEDFDIVSKATFVYRDEIFSGEKVTIERVGTFFDGELAAYAYSEDNESNILELHINELAYGTAFIDFTFDGWTAEQSIYFDGCTLAEVIAALPGNAIAGCKANIYDKDGNKLVYEEIANGEITVGVIKAYDKNNNVIAISAVGANDIDTITSLSFNGYTADQAIYLSISVSDLISYLNEAEAAGAAVNTFVGCEAKIYDVYGNLITVDKTTGKVTAVTLTGTEDYVSHGYEITLYAYYFDGFSEDITITIARFGYERIISIMGIEAEVCWSSNPDVFTGCCAKVLDKDGNVLVIDSESGVITSVIGKDGNVLYGTEE